MSINEMFQKIKPYYYLLLILVLFSIFTALMHIVDSKTLKTPIKITYTSMSNTALTINSENVDDVMSAPVIVSKNSKKYYFPWCGTIKMLKPDNQIIFTNIEEAKAGGYTPGGNCKGLK